MSSLAVRLRIYNMQLCQFVILSTVYALDCCINLILFLYSILIRAPFLCLVGCVSRNQDDKKQSIVIIGYSFSGFELHKLLQSEASLRQCTFTIIEPKQYFEFTPAILRTMVQPLHYESISFPITDCFDPTRSTLFHGKAIAIDSAKNSVTVKLNGGDVRRVPYDFCFVCTGSKYAAPIKVNVHPNIRNDVNLADRAQILRDINSTLCDEACQTIAIIGGGPVGVELMAEIVQCFPHKNITIIDANQHLCQSFPSSTQQYLESYVKAQPNVELRLNSRIKQIITPHHVDDVSSELRKSSVIISKNLDIEQDESKDVTACKYRLKFESEQTLEFDMVFKCAGFQPNSELLQNTAEFEQCLTDKYKFIKVDTYMRVDMANNSNVFAMGDVMQQPKVEEIKLAHTAEIHARYLRDLMIFMLGNGRRSWSDFVPYHEWLFGGSDIAQNAENVSFKMPLVFTISLGATDGSMGFGRILVNGFLSQILKWFIEISLCTLFQRKGLFHMRIPYNDVPLFTVYPIGYRIFSIHWWFSHLLTMWYIRHFG